MEDAQLMSKRRKKNTVVVNDGFSNPATRAGAGMPNVLNHTTYPLERKSWDYQKLTALYRNHWVIQTMVNVVPQDMLKNGYDLVTTLSPEDLDKVNSLLRNQSETIIRPINGMQQGISLSQAC